MINRTIKQMLDNTSATIGQMLNRNVSDYDYKILELLNSMVIISDALLAKIKVMEMMHGPDGH